jgi:hypothetical protein
MDALGEDILLQYVKAHVILWIWMLCQMGWTESDLTIEVPVEDF